MSALNKTVETRTTGKYSLSNIEYKLNTIVKEHRNDKKGLQDNNYWFNNRIATLEKNITNVSIMVN